MPQNNFEKQMLVVEELKLHGNITRAASAIGVDRRTVTRWRESNKLFNAACVDAIEHFKGVRVR